MADEFFFTGSKPDCRLPEVPKPPVDFVPECFIEPPPPPIFECIIPVPVPDPPPVFCPEFETTAALDVFYEDEECEDRTTSITLSITKTNDDPCEFDVDLDLKIGIPRPPCPTTKSEHKTHVGYEECLDCVYVGSVGSAEEVAGLAEDSFPLPPLPEEEADKIRPIFVTLEKVVTQVQYDGQKFVPVFSEKPFASVADLLAAENLGSTPGTVVGVPPFFKLISGKWMPVSAPVESATVNAFADLATIPLDDAPAGTILRVKNSSLYERQPNGSWVVVTFEPIDFTDETTGKLLTLNDLVNAPATFPTNTVVRVRLEGNTFSVIDGQITEVPKQEPNDWVFEEADLPGYLNALLAQGKTPAVGSVVGIAFPTDRYELLALKTGSGANSKRKTWAPARCKQNKFVFVTARPGDCDEKEEGCRLFLFTEITVPIPRQPCPEFNIREFEINTYIDQGFDAEGNNLCPAREPKFEIKKRPDDPDCNTPGKCEFDIDLVIDIPIPQVPCPEIVSNGLTVNTFFIEQDKPPGEDPDACCPMPENIIEVDDYDALLALTRRAADVGSFARQLDTNQLWERVGPLLYVDRDGDDDFDNIDDPSPELEPGVPADWVLADPCGSRFSIKTIQKAGTCQKPPECKFEVDLRINVPVPRVPCPEIKVNGPTVTTGFDDSPCVSCIADLTVDTVAQMYAIPRENRNYGMFVKIKLVYNSFLVGADGQLIPIGAAPTTPDLEFENWGQVPGEGNTVPPTYDDNGDVIEDVPPWERNEDDPPRVQNGTVISINAPATYFTAVDSVTIAGRSRHRWLPITNYSGSQDRVTTFNTTLERDAYFATNPVELPFLGPAYARVTNPPRTYIYVAEPLDGPDGFGGPTGWVALNEQAADADHTVGSPEEIGAIPPEELNPGDTVNVENPVSRYKLEADMETWTPAPCPENRFEVVATYDPPKDCRDPGRCDLTLDFEINIPVPKTPCPQINVRDFSVNTYSEEDEECPTQEDGPPACDVAPSSIVDSVADLENITGTDGMIVQVGQVAATSVLYQYSEAEGRWVRFIPTDADRKNCCGFNITKRNTSNNISVTVDTLPELTDLRVPEDAEPGSIAVVLNPPASEDPENEDPGPWFFRAGFPPEPAWSRMAGFDPCNPPPAECTFDVDLNICIPIPTVPCPEAKSQHKTHVGYEGEACVTCKTDETIRNASGLADLDENSFNTPPEESALRYPGPNDCEDDLGCNREEDRGPEPVPYYVGVRNLASQFTYDGARFNPSFFEQSFDSFAEAAADAEPGTTFTVNNQTPYFRRTASGWEPVSPPTAAATVQSVGELNSIPEEDAPPGTIIAVSGGGLFERRPNGSWAPVDFNPTVLEGVDYADLVNGQAGGDIANGTIVQVGISSHYGYDEDGQLIPVDKPTPNDWVFEEADFSAYAAQRARDGNAVAAGEIIGVAFPTDRYRLSELRTGEGDDQTRRTWVPDRCKQNKSVFVSAKDCAERRCKLFLFTEVAIEVPKPPCPTMTGRVRASSVYVNDQEKPCSKCKSDLEYATLADMTQDGASIGNGRPSADTCGADLAPGATAQVSGDETEPASRWRWEPDLGGWVPAPCGTSTFSFRRPPKPDYSAAVPKPKTALCSDGTAGELIYIEDLDAYYSFGADGRWQVVSPPGCTESSCIFDVDLDLSIPIPQPPCPIFNFRKSSVKNCGDFPRADIGISARPPVCDDKEDCIKKQCIFDIDFDFEIPCPKFNGLTTSINLSGPNGSSSGNIYFQKRCSKEQPKIECPGESHAVEDTFERDEHAREQLRNNPNLPVGKTIAVESPNSDPDGQPTTRYFAYTGGVECGAPKFVEVSGGAGSGDTTTIPAADDDDSRQAALTTYAEQQDADNPGLAIGDVYKTAQPYDNGAYWKYLGREGNDLVWERVFCDPEPEDICEFDVELSLNIPACESVEFAEDDDAGTHTGIAKADRFKHYYLKAGDDCPPDPNANPCFNPDDPAGIEVANDAELEQLRGKPPEKLRDKRDADAFHQPRAGDIFKAPIELAPGVPATDASGNPIFAWVRLDAEPPPSQRLTLTNINETDVPQTTNGGRRGLLLSNYNLADFDGLQEKLGTPPDPRLQEGVIIKVGQGANAVFKFFKNGVFGAAKKCGDSAFSIVIVKEAVLDNNGNAIVDAQVNKKRQECKFRYAAQIQICEKMSDHNAPCTKYHGDPCCDSGCVSCGANQENPCCTEEDKKEEDGNYPITSESEGGGGAAQPFRAAPRKFPTLRNTDSAGATGPGPDEPKDPCKDYVDEKSAGCSSEDTEDPGYRPFKSLELNIKENFPEDRLSPPKITYQLDAAPNCLHGGKVRISKTARPPAGGGGSGGTVGSFSALPTGDDGSEDAVAADLPILFNSGSGGTGTGPESCVASVVDADAIGEGTIEIVNNRINLCLKLYTDECDTDTPSGPSGSSSPTSSGATSAAFSMPPPQKLITGPRSQPAASEPANRLTATLLEDLISAINTHPELKEAIRNVVNQPD